jgi:hypothetical protein
MTLVESCPWIAEVTNSRDKTRINRIEKLGVRA